MSEKVGEVSANGFVDTRGDAVKRYRLHVFGLPVRQERITAALAQKKRSIITTQEGNSTWPALAELQMAFRGAKDEALWLRGAQKKCAGSSGSPQPFWR